MCKKELKAKLIGGAMDGEIVSGVESLHNDLIFRLMDNAEHDVVEYEIYEVFSPLPCIDEYVVYYEPSFDDNRIYLYHKEKKIWK